LEKERDLTGIVSKEKEVENDKIKILTKRQSDVRVQDKLPLKLKDPDSFVVTKYDKKSPNNSYYRIKVIDPSKDEKDNENIKENPQEVIAGHDDSKNTSRVKDRVFRASYENINSLSDTLNE
jgi:hypothetical protein